MRVSVLVRPILYMVIGGACWVPAAISGIADNIELETTFPSSMCGQREILGGIQWS